MRPILPEVSEISKMMLVSPQTPHKTMQAVLSMIIQELLYVQMLSASGVPLMQLVRTLLVSQVKLHIRRQSVSLGVQVITEALYVLVLLTLMRTLSVLFLAPLVLETSPASLISWVRLRAWARPILSEEMEVTMMLSVFPPTPLVQMHTVLSSVIQAMLYIRMLSVSMALLVQLRT